jgi:plasmid stability protein
MAIKEGVKPFALRLPAEEHEALRVMAAVTGKSMNELVVRAVREFMAGAGRRDEFEAAVSQVTTRYRTVLDKLGHM